MFLYLLGRHPEEVEADLAQAYNIDIVDLWRHRVTPRRLSVLTLQLPDGSRIWQATGGPKAWSDEVLTMMILDLRLRELFWTKTKDGQDGKNPPEIAPYPRHEDEVQAEADDLDAKAKKFQQMEARRAARAAARQVAQQDEG